MSGKNKLIEYEKKLNGLIDYLKNEFAIGDIIKSAFEYGNVEWGVFKSSDLRFNSCTMLSSMFSSTSSSEMGELLEQISERGFLRKEIKKRSTTRNTGIKKETDNITTTSYALSYNLFKYNNLGDYIFYAREFHNKTKQTYLDIKKVIEKYDLSLVMLEDNPEAGNIHSVMFERIKNCKFMIADLTSFKEEKNEKNETTFVHHINNNVLYEIGMAHANNKKVLIISNKEKKLLDKNSNAELPFDIGPHTTMEYEINDDYFIEDFGKWVESTLNEINDAN